MTRNVINIAAPTPEDKRLWAKALELAGAFGPDRRWAVIRPRAVLGAFGSVAA